MGTDGDRVVGRGEAPLDEDSALVFRPFSTHQDYQACVELQRETWGQHFAELVPPTVLKVTQWVGGVAAGAFDREGRLLGFVFGHTGVREGRLVHWSHMLAVRKDARDRGIGFRLKLYQRQFLLPLGVEAVYWTYDPLVARNAHLNLNRLGCQVVEYAEDMYGNMGSDLDRGIGTDRFLVAWRIADPEVERLLAGEKSGSAQGFQETPVVNSRLAGDRPLPAELELPEAPAVRVEIPADIQALKSQRPEEGAQWRANTRRVFQHYLSRGYEVAAFFREAASGRCFYGVLGPSHEPT